MNKRQLFNKLRFYSGFILLAFYWLIGILFIFTEIWVDLLPKGRYLIGIILILWGSLRFYVAYRRYISKALKLQLKNKTEDAKTE